MTGDDPGVGAQGSVEDFAALAAHQLGEAVALVRGAAAVLEAQQAGLGAHGDDALRAIGAGADRAQRFVDDLLDVVRVAAEPDATDGAELDAALDVAVAALATAIERERVQVQRDPLPRAGVDRHEAERLMLHLLRSAMAAGARRVRVAATPGDTGVVLEVLDDGAPPRAGVPAFAPFARPRGRGPLVGAGVSLTVCRRIVERRGGSIALEVRPDATTHNTQRLPGAG
jgi:two-component system NtrC family sensor kinase